MITNILKDISNPRLDICFLFKNFNEEISILYNFLTSKNLMCAAFGMNDNRFYKSDYLNNISNDLILYEIIEKSYIIICFDEDFNLDKFENIKNKITYINSKLFFNNKILNYLNKNNYKKNYNFNNNDDLNILYDIIIKAFKQNYKIICCISHMNEKTLDLCIESIKSQSIPIDDEIKVFSGLRPMYNSFNSCLEYACDKNADLLLHTAADVIFEPWTLKELLRLYDPKKHANVLSYGDDILLKYVNNSYAQRTVCGIWIFNMNLFKNKEYRFRDEMSQDMKLFARVKEQTGLIVNDNYNNYLNQKYIDYSSNPLFDLEFSQQNLGIHHPIWTLREIFDKYYYGIGWFSEVQKDNYLKISKEFLKYNPENNCLKLIVSILENIKSNKLKSKDSDELEKIYKNEIKNLLNNNYDDDNKNFFVFHEKYINICNKLYNVNIINKSYDNIFCKDNNIYFTDEKYDNYFFYRNYNNNKSINCYTYITSKTYSLFIKSLNKYKNFFCFYNKDTNYLLYKEKYVNNILKNIHVLLDIKNPDNKIKFIVLLYIFFYDLFFTLLYFEKGFDTTGRRNKILEYILKNIKNYSSTKEINNISVNDIKEYNKIYESIIKLDFIDEQKFIENIDSNFILNNSFKLANNFIFQEKEILQNHFITLSKDVQKIILIKTDDLLDRNIILINNNIQVNFNIKDKKLLMMSNTDNFLFNLLEDNEKFIILINTKYFNNESTNLFFTTNDFNIQYFGDSRKKYKFFIN